MSSSIDLSYPAVQKLFAQHLVPGRTESRAFLAWFLENYYRLDEFDAQDAICDGTDDKGVDAIYVYDNLEAIDIFQCKLFQNNSKTLGESSLRDFIGTLSQFQTATFIEMIEGNTTNVELAGLLREQKVAEKVRQGYSVRGVFLTNVIGDQSTRQYLAGHANVQLFDAPELQKLYVSPLPSRPQLTL
ncbi:hypothetical protein HC928_09395 [bacterium]|nr:hypothetical protein [bacterium]